MLQHIHPHQLDSEYIAVSRIREDDRVLYFKGDSLLLKRDGEAFDIPRKKELECSPEGTFLFRLNGVNCFLVSDCGETDGKKFTYHEVSFFRALPQKEIAWAGAVAFQLMNWYVQNKFCGKCGTLTVIKDDERAIACPACKTLVFPRISPAVIVAIISGDKILLARGVNFRGSFYSLVAGYADIGESLEEAVVREVKEEVGLDVKNVRYYKSQPWPFSGAMMVGYVAEADSSQPIRACEKEITEAAWFTRGNLPEHPTAVSIAGEMIEEFEKGLLE